MPYRVAQTSLNASTIDILNVIRQNASQEYQSLVPTITQEKDIPKVGEAIFGTPGLSNQFINALVNRIALVAVKSATFNNPYERLKKGYLYFGETVEEIFVDLVKPLEFSAEKASGRELKRYMPNVRSAFHVMNWRVMYPVTIQDADLKRAFLSIDGVRDLISSIVEAIYTAAKYDEFLLFKYLIIKAVSNGQMKPIAFDATDFNEAATVYRGTSNKMEFLRRDYNAAGVNNSTPKSRQFIFMDADYNAAFDVEVLARAFNMEKAEFMGNLMLIDDWTTFDNDRFDVIRANSDGIEEVTSTELGLMANVKAVLVDGDWFQVYDNETQFTEKYVASGLYWNYFYHQWKTISSSPFANAVVLVDDAATVSAPSTVDFTVASISDSDIARVYTLELKDGDTVQDLMVEFTQDQTNTAAGIAVQKYGAFIVPATVYTGNSPTASISIYGSIGTTAYSGAIQLLPIAASGNDPAVAATAVGDTIRLSKVV